MREALAGSDQLLARLGFEAEGRARAYLKINGAWEDHVPTALVAPGVSSMNAVGATLKPTA